MTLPQWPDLVIIDGGRGQLNAVGRSSRSSDLTEVPLMAVAKGPDRDAGRETLFMPEREAIKLEPRDPVLYFIQRLRDEAHRFVIGSHRTAAQEGHPRGRLAGNPGHRPVTQACTAAPFRNAEGDRAGLDRATSARFRASAPKAPARFSSFSMPQPGLNDRADGRASSGCRLLTVCILSASATVDLHAPAVLVRRMNIATTRGQASDRDVPAEYPDLRPHRRHSGGGRLHLLRSPSWTARCGCAGWRWPSLSPPR